jgi:hypothetical protein
MLREGRVGEEAGGGVGADVVFRVHAGGKGAGVGMPHRVQEDGLSRLTVPGLHGGRRLGEGAQFKNDGEEIVHLEGVLGRYLGFDVMSLIRSASLQAAGCAVLGWSRALLLLRTLGSTLN